MIDKLISDDAILVDAELLPLFEKARNGCLDSQLKLITAFSDGTGAKKNEVLTSELEAMIFNSTDNNRFKLAALWNPAIRESEKGNSDEMIAQFHRIIYFMQEHIPMQEWNFDLFTGMEKLINSIDDQK
jgi:hypothetical protein